MELSNDNIDFSKQLKENYVDKSMFISFLNHSMDQNCKFCCFIKPRRFGKTYVAEMLRAYYSKECDSEELFSKLKIAKDPSFKEHLNKYDVIYLNMNSFVQGADKKGDYFLHDLKESLFIKLVDKLDEKLKEKAKTLENIEKLLRFISDNTIQQFVFIIDEWDNIYRTFEKNKTLQKDYVMLLSNLFKGSFASNIALAYMTGILPIKRYGNQSIFNNFDEISMLDTYGQGEFFGFTETEVKDICQKYDLDFAKTKAWYDGYHLDGYDIYNPYAIIKVARSKTFGSTWSNSASIEVFEKLIKKNTDNLRDDLAKLLCGEKIYFSVENLSQNEIFKLNSKQAIFTCLIYLGYLALSKDGVLYIPNEDVKKDIVGIFLKDKIKEDNDVVYVSKSCFEALIDGNSKEVAANIEKIHDSFIPVNKYNNEDSLRSVVLLSLVYALNFYKTPICELPSGKGFADIVLIPKNEFKEQFPGIVIELKWDKGTDSALKQIKTKDYCARIHESCNDILLVGINYSAKDKKHTCVIEKI